MHFRILREGKIQRNPMFAIAKIEVSTWEFLNKKIGFFRPTLYTYWPTREFNKRKCVRLHKADLKFCFTRNFIQEIDT